MKALRFLPALVCVIALSSVFADGSADNKDDKVRPVPPPGIEIANADRMELVKSLVALQIEISTAGKRIVRDLLPDVEIYTNAVRYALDYNEFFDPKEVATARALLKEAKQRLDALRDGKSPWTTQTGLVVRGYVSKIDGSVQPYGLVVPASYQPSYAGEVSARRVVPRPRREADRAELLNGRQKSPGEFDAAAQPSSCILYGRYCCANKFAGEIDCLEALADVEKHYPIDENRRVIRGFSMGGAACWQFAVHYPSLWCCGRARRRLRRDGGLPQGLPERRGPADVVREEALAHVRLHRLRAATCSTCPTVAYSGEKDKQKQAADMMAAAMKKEGMTLVHLIGPGTGHAYHPDTKKEINRRIDRIAERGRDTVPSRVNFTTYTLRYNRSFWVRIDGLEKHWERADVDAKLLTRQRRDRHQERHGLHLEMDAGDCPLDPTDKPSVTIDEDEVEAAPILSDRSWKAHFRQEGRHLGGRREAGRDNPAPSATACRVRSTMRSWSSFMIVEPTGKPMNDQDRRLGRRRDETGHRTLAEAVPRRGAGQEGRTGHRR